MTFQEWIDRLCPACTDSYKLAQLHGHFTHTYHWASFKVCRTCLELKYPGRMEAPDENPN